jgi:hypothetical protein
MDGSPYNHVLSQANTEWRDIFQKTELYEGGGGGGSFYI